MFVYRAVDIDAIALEMHNETKSPAYLISLTSYENYIILELLNKTIVQKTQFIEHKLRQDYLLCKKICFKLHLISSSLIL